jgi:hypothetical protein
MRSSVVMCGWQLERPENTHPSARRKFSALKTPTAHAFATAAGMCSHSTSATVIATLPASDTIPAPAWKRARRPSSCAGPPPARSRHVQRSCQTKLWSTAASTAMAVARAVARPAVAVSSCSAAS